MAESKTPPVPHELLRATVATCAAVVAVRAAGPLGLALATLWTLAWCTRHRRLDWIAWSVPAALGALPTPELSGGAWPESGFVRFRATIVESVRDDPRSGRSTFRARCGDVPCRLTVAWERRSPSPELGPGDTLSGTGRLDRNRRQIDTREGAFTVEPGRNPRAALERARRALQREITSRVPGSEGHVLSHLVLDRGPPIAETIKNAHRASGLAHLLAVSGAHATLIAWLLAATFAGISRRDPWLRRSFRRGTTLFLLLYGALTGWDPPVVRALVAWTLLAHASARGRRLPFSSALAAPALVTAVACPDDLFSVSFCLSYAAVVGLYFAGRSEQDVLQAPLRSSAWALLMTAPLCLWWFGQLAPWTIVGTPICGSLVAAMLALGVLTAVLAPLIPTVADGTAAIAGQLTSIYLAIVDLLAALPGAPVLAPERPSVGVLAGFVILGIGVGVAVGRRLGVALSLIVTCLPFFLPVTPRGAPRVVLVDVGHGQACLAHLPSGQTVLVDCGSKTAGNRAARGVLNSLGPRRRIDWLIVSHADFDHVSGIESLSRQVTIRNALIPAHLETLATRLERHGIRVQRAAVASRATPLDGVEVLHPALTGTSSRNDRSLWVRLDLGTMAVLLPGDAERRGIEAASRRSIVRPVDVLVLPHHGRGDPSALTDLLRRTRPRHALVSSGEPLTKLGDVALRFGVPVTSTAVAGSITLGATVATERDASLRR